MTIFEDVTILDAEDLETFALSIAAGEIARDAIRTHGISTAGKLLVLADRIRRDEIDGTPSDFLNQLREAVDAPGNADDEQEYGANFRLRNELYRLAEAA